MKVSNEFYSALKE